MKIEHVALYTDKLEEMKDFYTCFFKGKASSKYVNDAKGFESYFITFASGARLEIMRQQGLDSRRTLNDTQYLGWSHIAFSVGSKEQVDQLTRILEERGFQKVSGPRTTGDGYYESCILDPDGNRVEITE